MRQASDIADISVLACPPRLGRAITVAAILGLTGCSNNSLTETIGVAVGSTVQSEPPVEIYSRVARGALSCWFGPHGSLKKTHVFHADAAPPSAGGEAEIVLHERDQAAQSPRSLRAFRVVFAKSNEGTHVKIENLRFPETTANDMKADVVRWAAGKFECSVVGVGGWAAGAPPAKAVEPAKARVKSPTKATKQR